MKKIIVSLMVVMGILTGCNAAETASYNLSREADEFKIIRRVVFYNAIQDKYILQLEGRCSISVDKENKQLEVTVKIGENQYQKHFLGLSDNVTYTVEQIGTANVNEYKYKMYFKPESIMPIDIDIKN